MAITGECFCGSVKYRIDGELSDARSCHCSRCRKAFSAQASAYALVQPAEFQWLAGQHFLTEYLGEHGAGVRFCGRCGSTLVGVVNGDVHGVALGCLNGNPEVRLERHIHVGSKASWETIAEGVPQYLDDPPSEAGGLP